MEGSRREGDPARVRPEVVGRPPAGPARGAGARATPGSVPAVHRYPPLRLPRWCRGRRPAAPTGGGGGEHPRRHPLSLTHGCPRDSADPRCRTAAGHALTAARDTTSTPFQHAIPTSAERHPCSSHCHAASVRAYRDPAASERNPASTYRYSHSASTDPYFAPPAPHSPASPTRGGAGYGRPGLAGSGAARGGHPRPGRPAPRWHSLGVRGGYRPAAGGDCLSRGSTWDGVPAGIPRFGRALGSTSRCAPRSGYRSPCHRA